MMKKVLLVTLALLLFLPFQMVSAQSNNDSIPKDWFHSDPEKTGIYGISTAEAFKLMKRKKPKKIIVAVLDTGVDPKHEDLQSSIWANTDEIAGNEVDDDLNGYVDDINGWNFLGGPDGDVNQDTHELTREYVRLKKKFGDKERANINDRDSIEYQHWKEIEKTYLSWSAKSAEEGVFYNTLYENAIFFDSLFKKNWEVETITQDDLYMDPEDDSLTNVGKGMLNFLFTATEGKLDWDGILKELKSADKYYRDVMKYTYNTEFNPRDIIGDDYNNIWERDYGNNNVKGPYGGHGTSVSGVIAAKRDNGIGIDGIAPNAIIMPVRVVPGGDERDKDVANGIRYAVDNGAKIINMSFGKRYSPGKQAVDSAVAYAMKNNVLLIHASGNESDDRDIMDRFPTPIFEDGRKADNWLDVGASGWKADSTLAGSFSNYGKKTVHLFAPGVQIYSLNPGNEYGWHDGTSLAAPVVSGVAALIWGYYPDLSYQELIEIMMKSVVKVDQQVMMPGSDGKKVAFEDLSISGGIINLYNALNLAKEY